MKNETMKKAVKECWLVAQELRLADYYLGSNYTPPRLLVMTRSY